MELFAHYHVSIFPQVCILMMFIIIGVNILKHNGLWSGGWSIVGWAVSLIAGGLLIWLISWYGRMQRMWQENFYGGIQRRNEYAEELFDELAWMTPEQVRECYAQFDPSWFKESEPEEERWQLAWDVACGLITKPERDDESS